MLAIVQRVSSASVFIESKVVAEINKGLMVLVCVESDDTEQNLSRMAEKLINYRIFADGDDKMNLSVLNIQGQILIVPQFTLAVSTSKGLRPSFSRTCPPDIASKMFDKFIDILRSKYEKIQIGVFGADMKVSLINDGPVTFNFKV